MRVSYPWLRDFVDIDILGVETTKVANALTMVGLKVEEIQEFDGSCVFDVEVTTNRPDCLNHLGIAREIAAHFRLRLKPPDFSPPQNEEHNATVLSSSVTIENSDLCPRYAARVITGIRIEESPDWLRARLEAVGQRPINNIVDITNYVMLEVGHPLHAFDYEKLQENRIVVRTAKRGESLITLDGVQRRLDSPMLMICDAADVVALAGIMGGEESEVSEGSRSILLESAYFNPATVQRTAQSLGLRTEASFRFERGADAEMPVKALNRACRLIQEIAGGTFASPVMDEYPNPQPQRTLQLRSERIRKVVGVSVDAEFVTDTLPRLQFKVSHAQEGVWQVKVPSFRVDIGIEDDLVEEVARHYGYDRIQTTYPAPSGIGSFLSTDNHDRILTRTLGRFGFLEAFNYVFTNPSKETPFWNHPPSMVAISNPLTEEDTHLRVSLVPGLVETLRRNFHRGNKVVRLFEFGKVFTPSDSGDAQDFKETPRLALLATGEFYQPFWNTFRDEFHFHHLKGIVEVLLEELGHQAEFEARSDIALLHPGIAARVLVNGEALGVLGQLHPRLQETYKFLQTVLVAELSLDPIYRGPLREPQYESLGRFPSIERDLCFVVDKKVEYATMLSALRELDIPDLQDIQLVDLYQGSTLPRGKVSLAIRLTFASPKKTLMQEEVNRYTDEIFSVLKATFSAEARS